MKETTRRQFLRQGACAAVGMGALANQLLGLRALNAAVAQSGGADDGYRALVCIFLYGGNDANNMIVPRGLSEHAAYAAARQNLTIDRASLLGINPERSDGREWGFHPSLGGFDELDNPISGGLHELFQQNKLALIGNVGTLVAPVTRADWQSGRAVVPAQLFSHADQQVQWQTSVSKGVSATGWGGRLADLLRPVNTGSVSMSLSIAGTNSFQVGQDVTQYQVRPSGSVSLRSYRPSSVDPNHRPSRAVDNLLNLAHGNLLQDAYAGVQKRSLENDRLLNEALDNISPEDQTWIDTNFDRSNSLSDQLQMVARLISAREDLGMKRQIFFCSVGGYDTHGEQLISHGNLMRELSQGLREFYDATEHFGVADCVTTFTASDFGRTFPTNGEGSDHGWGSHQLVMGGAVKGGDIHGIMPTLEVNGPNDTGRGRWIPTTSVDEYSATLARWFGLAPSDLAQVFPNIGRFSNPDLGFML